MHDQTVTSKIVYYFGSFVFFKYNILHFLIVYFLLSSSFLPEKVELATLAPDGDSSVQNRNGLTPVSYITRTLPQGKECQRRQEG